MMIKDIKLAIFDFDNTLAIYDMQEPHPDEYTGDSIEWYKEALLNPERFYEEYDPRKTSDKLQEIIACLRENGAKMFCVSHMQNTLNFTAKQSYVQNHYGSDIDLIATCSAEQKVEVVRILCRAFDCQPNEVIVFDDLQETVETMLQHGYNAYLEEEAEGVWDANAELV